MLTPLLSRWYARLAQAVDWTVGWTRLPPPLGVATLLGLRRTLRRRNLYDTSALPATPGAPPAGEPPPRYLTARTADGTYNDLDDPAMGSAGMRFGRNVPLNRTFPEPEPAILMPNPRTVSRELFTRDTFKPATTLNLLAAAWIQFMVHDWLSHGKNQKQDPWIVPLAEDDPWPQHPMRILRASRDPSRPAGYQGPPTFANIATHWWDGSQIYGSDQATQDQVRAHEDGKLILDRDGLLPIDPTTGIDITGVNGNWWIGLTLMHTLFTLEHNTICDRLRAAYPSWSDDDLFDHARLINVALMAKIHTVEWTPGILGHPTMQVAMRGEWWGLATERLHKLFGRISANDVISGLPGSPKNHHGVPYAMTEEFAAVYRMHPLIPDDIRLRAVADDRLLHELTFPEVVDRHAHEVVRQVGMANALYSFGTSHPGAITLHNHPRFLQQRVEADGTIIDVAATDVLRMRERGVPRYNEFRQLLHRPPVATFEELTDNPVWVEELRRVYDDDIDRVDLVVGLLAEPLPPGFGFSDTALRVFLLMAPRRLQSDRFFTTDYTPTVYTLEGLDWIDANSMATVLLRHFPALAPALRNVQNPFAPWTRARSAPPFRRRDTALGTAVTAAQDGTPKVIPTVRELPLVGSLFALQSDALAFVKRVVRECGDMRRFHLGPVEGFVLGAPAAIRGVLVDDAGAFDKGGLMLNAYHTIGQTPVLIREGEEHREEREILDPIFQPEQLARYSAAMSAHAEQAQRAWTDGATIDIQQQMLEMTLRIMGKVLFGVDGLCATDPLAASLTTIADYLAQGVRTPLLLPLSIPTPDNIRVRRSLDVAHRRLQVAIDERRSGGLDGKMDFLAMLLKAQDADGAGLSDAQVCDDAVEIFNAGHGNVGVALAWCVYLLATHPDVSARVQEEVDRVLGGRTPTYADLDQLPYTLQVVKETLRLYPPIYILSPRRALRDVTIDGYVVRQGNLILISPYALHHRCDLFPDPERFDPDRFAPQRAQIMPPYAWIPLGAGPHTCAGSHFALMEAHVVVATLAQRVTFSLAPGQRVVPEAGPVLRQAEGCKVIIHHRT